MKHLSALLIIAAILSTKSPAQITAALYKDLPVDCWMNTNFADSNTPSVNKIEAPSTEPATVNVQDFSSNVSGKKVVLTWSVAENKAANYFEVQRSKDGKTYTTCGLVFCSEKSGAEEYAFFESKQNAGTYYRLKVVNQDHSFSFSGIIPAITKTDVTNSRIHVFQNAAASNFTLNYTSLVNEAHNVTVFNAEGTVLYTTTVNFTKGVNTIHFNLNNTSKPGAYIAEVANSTERNTTKFFKK